jgi:hypothetical protein
MSKKTIVVSCLILIITLCAGAVLNARIAHNRIPDAHTLRTQSTHSGDRIRQSFSPREYIRIVRQSEE